MTLALVLGCVLTPDARAQSSVRVTVSGSSGSLDLRFGSEPRWSEIEGTRILQIEERDCPDHDVFRYGGVYYVFDGGHWYSSRHGRGRYVVIEDRRVPAALCALPREHWRRYPSAWMDRNRGSGRARGHVRDHDREHGNGNGLGEGHGRR